MLISILIEMNNIEEYVSLKEIVDGIVFDEESIIYNFEIHPVKFEEKCKIIYFTYFEISVFIQKF